MRKIAKNQWVGVAIIAFTILSIMLIRNCIGCNYSPNMESALERGWIGYEVKIITIIPTENYAVAVYESATTGVRIANFRTRERNGQIVYRRMVVDHYPIVGLHPHVMVNTFYNVNRPARRLTTEERLAAEKVAVGIGQEWGEYYSEITGIQAQFVPFYWNRQEYVLWYIVGRENLNDVPRFRAISPHTGSEIILD